jgi:hypothetical protein
MNLLSGARSAPVKEKNSKVPGGQSAAGAPPHQPTAAKSWTPEARQSPQATRGDHPTSNCQATATSARSGLGGGWGGGVGGRREREGAGGIFHRKAGELAITPPPDERANLSFASSPLDIRYWYGFGARPVGRARMILF